MLAGMSDPESPMFRVTRGNPTPEELAALVGVLWARRQAAALAIPPAPARSRWRAPLGRPLPAAGPGAWSRAS
jgi:Acyl-CoA carboxylase epsilon subunit